MWKSRAFAPGVSRITYSALLPSDWRAAASDTGTLDWLGPRNTLTRPLLGRVPQLTAQPGPRLDLAERVLELILRDLCVIGGLCAEPVAIREAEKPTQTQVRVSCDRALAGDDRAATLRR